VKPRFTFAASNEAFAASTAARRSLDLRLGRFNLRRRYLHLRLCRDIVLDRIVKILLGDRLLLASGV
jgi:hypothetical protein